MAPSVLHALAKVLSSATASRENSTARRSPSVFARLASLNFRSAASDAVVAWASGGVAFTSRSDSPARLRSAHQPQRYDVPARDAGHLSVHDRLDAVAQRDLARHLQVHARGGLALHAAQRAHH